VVETVVPGAVESWPGTTVMPQAETAQMRSPPIQTEIATPMMEVAQLNATALLQTVVEQLRSPSA
jgi:hypothetical protein